MRNIERLHERAGNMRILPTIYEWQFKKRLDDAGVWYANQKVIGNYIVDFCIGKTIIEIDGENHSEDEQALYDKQRTQYLERLGYEVVRIKNEHVSSFDLTCLIHKKKKKNKGRKGKSKRKTPKHLQEPFKELPFKPYTKEKISEIKQRLKKSDMQNSGNLLSNKS